MNLQIDAHLQAQAEADRSRRAQYLYVTKKSGSPPRAHYSDKSGLDRRPNTTLIKRLTPGPDSTDSTDITL